MTIIIILLALLFILLIPFLFIVDLFLILFAILIIISDISVLKQARGKKGAIEMVVDDTMEALDEVTDIKDYAADAVEIVTEAASEVANKFATAASVGAEAVKESIDAL